MTAFTVTSCSPQGEIVQHDPNSPFLLVEQSRGETYMGERRFVLHRDEVDILVRALKAAR